MSINVKDLEKAIEAFNHLCKIIDDNKDKIDAVLNKIDEHKKKIKKCFEDMNNDTLMLYVPDVFQKSIYSINYNKLKEAGIEIIVFNINSTIANKTKANPPTTAIILFSELKKMGFKLYVRCKNLSRAENFAKKLGIPENYIAEDVSRNIFTEIQKKHNIDGNKMIYIGHRQIKDIGSGGTAGIYTCLVRDDWKPSKIGGFIKNNVGDEGHELRKILKERGIWRKHHAMLKGDQYYQLGETPPYKKSGIS
ncbi:MAG: hypothetical protein NC253_01760 [Ruminococcus sp.]|nr:hypothetical protein [Ruminococcus sp.]MCM1381209.1 hypothetical protein [Muribaculaceae bacterium]MCM1478721.1 hypothetical protein [Muribaculaceae bacterium]